MAMSEWTEQLTRLLRESVNASVEAAVKFQEQTWRMIDELVQRGTLAKGEAKQLLDAWTQRTEEFQERLEEKYRKWEEGLKAGLGSYMPPSRKEVLDLHRKLDQLMANLRTVGVKRGQAGGTPKKAQGRKTGTRRKRR
jgi:polyhydroxyalkanoate synthesis regulator phasin